MITIQFKYIRLLLILISVSTPLILTNERAKLEIRQDKISG